jgi:hypothetical protein
MAGPTFGHPTIEGGIKQGLLEAKNPQGEEVMGGHVELVADPTANELRIYLSHAIDEKIGDTNHEWVQTLRVRNQVISGRLGKKEDVVLLPVPEPGEGNQWFPVPPVDSKGGFQYYWIEFQARVVLDGNSDDSRTLHFTAGQDKRGTQCLKAALDLQKARTIRLGEVLFSVNDPAGEKPPLVKKCFDGNAWGLGQLWKNVNTVDLPLKKFEEFIGRIPEMDKFRKPQVPAS